MAINEYKYGGVLMTKPYYEKENAILIHADSFKLLEKIKPESMDMIFADPPYFLSNGGMSNSGGKIVSVDKGDWDKISSFEEKHDFNRRWIRLARLVLKPNGTIWVSGSLHNIYSVGMALEQEGFKILNNITWQRQILHLIYHVGTSPTLQRQFYGQERTIKNLAIIITMN